jgi:hypothetical protein
MHQQRLEDKCESCAASKDRVMDGVLTLLFQLHFCRVNLSLSKMLADDKRKKTGLLFRQLTTLAYTIEAGLWPVFNCYAKPGSILINSLENHSISFEKSFNQHGLFGVFYIACKYSYTLV